MTYCKSNENLYRGAIESQIIMNKLKLLPSVKSGVMKKRQMAMVKSIVTQVQSPPEKKSCERNHKPKLSKVGKRKIRLIKASHERNRT